MPRHLPGAPDATHVTQFPDRVLGCAHAVRSVFSPVVTRQHPRPDEKAKTGWSFLFFLDFSAAIRTFPGPSCFLFCRKPRKAGTTVKVHEAAYRLLMEEGRPLSARELGRRALERGMVASNAADPELSIASTIEKNIRSGTYNRPQLAFLSTPNGRRIGLPSWKPKSVPAAAERRMVSVQIPAELAEKIKLAAQAHLAPTFDATTALLLRKGLQAAAPEIKIAVMRQLDLLEHAS